ncbi:hypothetical protein MXB90_16910 [Phaeovulum sp. NW3]|nr:hypothetical protein [Phaeovulum sp. NW3]
MLWYSQRITHAIGSDALTRYSLDFGYGTADFSSDAGFDNGHWPGSASKGHHAVPERRQSASIPGFWRASLFSASRGPTFKGMLTIIPLVRFRIFSGSLLTRTLPRAEAVTC